jgi:hypothetical protein
MRAFGLLKGEGTMNNKKVLFSILIITVILLTAGVPPTRALSPVGQAGSPGQGLAAAASGGAPINNPFLIADQSINTEDPAVAYDSQRQEYLVVWWNNRPYCPDIYGQRVSKSGALVGPWFSIAAGCPAKRSYPDVAYNSQQDQYLVVWLEQDGNYSIRGQRLSATGQLQGGEISIAVSTSSVDYFNPAVAYDSTYDKYLVVYSDADPATGKEAVIAQALNSDGSDWGSSFEITSNLPVVYRPDVAYNPLRNEFLAAWVQGSPPGNVMARRVKMAGGAGVLGSILTISSDPSNNNTSPHIAAVSRSPDGQYLVVWGHCKNNLCSVMDTLAQLVSGAGNLEGGTIQFPTPLNIAYDADVTGCENSSAYFVTWTQANTFPGDIAGRFVSVGGLMQPDFWLSGASAQPAVACGPHGDYLVVYTDTPTTSNYDIWGRLVGNRVYLPVVVK